MSNIPQEMKDALRVNIRAAVHDTFEDKLSPVEIDESEDEVVDESDETVEEGKGKGKYKKTKEAAKKDDEAVDEEDSDSESDDDDSDDSDDDDDSEEDEEDDRMDEEEDFFESIQVTATKKGSRGTKNDEETITIRRMSELNKLAKSGNYEYFVIKKRNGEETDYHVDQRGRLVEM